MKSFTPEISWHNRLPVLALDIEPCTDSTKDTADFYRVATGGNDCRVYIWHIERSLSKQGKLNNKRNKLVTNYEKPTVNSDEHNLSCTQPPDIRIVAGLRRHQKSVGAIRFSTDHTLASGDDDGYIIIWHMNENGKSTDDNAFLNDDGFEDLECWQQKRVLRGHVEDVCDLAWSKDGTFLLSGSVDNSAILWDANKGIKVWASDKIKGYVQGVSIDPNQYSMAIMSTDQALRVYDLSAKKLLSVTRRMKLEENFEALYNDDTVQTFCRRLDYSPDGGYLIVPAAQRVSSDSSETKSSENILLVFKRPYYRKPMCYYMSWKEVALGIRFSPIVYKLRDTGDEQNLWKLPYRMIFAVITSRTVLIYDTQQSTPIGYACQVHLARLTDLAWSDDGQILMISSYDGYSTLLEFEEGEFGEVYRGPLITEFEMCPEEKAKVARIQEREAQRAKERELKALEKAREKEAKIKEREARALEKEQEREAKAREKAARIEERKIERGKKRLESQMNNGISTKTQNGSDDTGEPTPKKRANLITMWKFVVRKTP